MWDESTQINNAGGTWWKKWSWWKKVMLEIGIIAVEWIFRKRDFVSRYYESAASN